MAYEQKKISFLKKLFNSWQHFGTKMLLSKAWERFVADKYRFRAGLDRRVPAFEPCRQDMKKDKQGESGSRSITVCYFLHYFFPDKQGGTERFVLNLAHAQIALGNHVHVITLGKRTLDEYEYHSGEIFWTKFEYEGIPVIQMRYRRAPRGLYYRELDENEPSLCRFAQEIIRKYQPDIVHLAYPQPFLSVAKVCREQKIPVVATLTDFNMICHYATMVDKKGNFCAGSHRGQRCGHCKTYELKDPCARYRQAAEFLASVGEITVPSAFVANVFSNDFPEFRCGVIPHGISNQFIRIEKKRERTRQFLYAGTLSPLKGVHLLIQAFQALEGPACLKIVGTGDGMYCSRLKRLAEKDPRIRFYGGVPPEEMPRLYQESDCVVVPSIWYETYNFVLREAMSCGCLGLCSDIGAMPEAVQPGRNGFLFEPGSIDSLLHALRQARDFDWNNYVFAQFPGVEDETERYQRLYQNMLRERTKEPAEK